MSIGNVYSELVPVDASTLAPKGIKSYSLVSAVTLAQAAGGSIPAGATFVLIVSEDFPFRWRDDGTPATVGADGAGVPVQKMSYKGTLSNLTLAPMSSSTLTLAFYG